MHPQMAQIFFEKFFRVPFGIQVDFTEDKQGTAQL